MVGKTACLITRSSLLDGNGCFCQKCAERAAHVLDGHASRQLASSFCQKGAERAAHVAARRLKRSPSGISEIAHVSIEAFTGGQRWHWNDQSGKESLLSSPKEGRAKSVHVWTSLQHRPFFGRESHLPHDLMDVPSHKNHIACAEDSCTAAGAKYYACGRRAAHGGERESNRAHPAVARSCQEGGGGAGQGREQVAAYTRLLFVGRVCEWREGDRERTRSGSSYLLVKLSIKISRLGTIESRLSAMKPGI